jgi:hypothetical protein
MSTLAATSRRVRAVRLRPRAALALLVVSGVGLLAFTWPLFVQPGSQLAGRADACSQPVPCGRGGETGGDLRDGEPRLGSQHLGHLRGERR